MTQVARFAARDAKGTPMEQPAPPTLAELTAPDVLEGLGQRPLAEVRALRDACRDEESRLSYRRRLLQGKLDIVRSELAHRSGDRDVPQSLVSDLASILADAPSDQPREARTVSFYPATGDTDDDPDDGPTLAAVPDLDTDALVQLVRQLQEREVAISAARRTLLDNLDHLQTELVGRYRDRDEELHNTISAALRDASGNPDR
ncbi:aerial mycelium formation protein [soil metagenome]